MNFEFVRPYNSEEEEEEVKLSDEEIEKAVKEDDILKKMIQNSPSDFLEFLGLARKTGIIPSQEIFDKWSASEGGGNALSGVKTDGEIEFTRQ